MTENIAQLMDHTLLKPEATLQDIDAFCQEAKTHRFWSVCVNPYWISTVKKILAGSEVKICTVAAVEAGADEIDMVLNLGAAREGHWDFIEHEIHEVVSASQGRVTKVILETCLLSPEQIAEACRRVVSAQAHFVKTSTGFNKRGATVEAVKLMRQTVGCRFGVKASGGIRDRATAEAMLEAGANRLGTSASVAIVAGTAGASAY